MRSNKKLLAEANLYLILDAQVLDYDSLLRVLKIAVRSGVNIVQFRDKNGTAKQILDFSRKALSITKQRIPFIVNDRADLGFFAAADGLHVGQEDLDCELARKMMGQGKLIGVSCQNLAHALKAQADGADYIGFGSVFKTKTKPGREPMDLDLLKRIVKQIEIPVFFIGGISRQNIHQLIGLGIRRVAVCRDILLAKDPAKAIKELKHRLKAEII